MGGQNGWVAALSTGHLNDCPEIDGAIIKINSTDFKHTCQKYVHWSKVIEQRQVDKISNARACATMCAQGSMCKVADYYATEQDCYLVHKYDETAALVTAQGSG